MHSHEKVTVLHVVATSGKINSATSLLRHTRRMARISQAQCPCRLAEAPALSTVISDVKPFHAQKTLHCRKLAVLRRHTNITKGNATPSTHRLSPQLGEQRRLPEPRAHSSHYHSKIQYELPIFHDVLVSVRVSKAYAADLCKTDSFP